MARARRDTLIVELNAARSRVKEVESLMRSVQQEVYVAQLDLQEAEKHIGWIQQYTRIHALYRQAQDPALHGLRVPSASNIDDCLAEVNMEGTTKQRALDELEISNGCGDIQNGVSSKSESISS